MDLHAPMTQTSPATPLAHPGLRMLARLARGLAWTLVWAGVALLLVWGCIHALIVPRIGELRPWIERQVVQKMGVNLRMGELSAHSEGWIPTFEIQNLQVLASDQPQDLPSLSVARLVMRLSMRSLTSLSFDQVHLEGLEIEVGRDAQGQWQVGGQKLDGADNSDALDWFFSQAEFVVSQGRVRWRDDTRPGPEPVWLENVTAVVRNHLNQHDLRLDATPPAGWGDRLSLRGNLRQPLLSLHNGRWQEWSGQLYVKAPRLDAAWLRTPSQLGNDADPWLKGAGAVEAWVDVVAPMQISGITADLLFDRAEFQWASGLTPLDLRDLKGRVGYARTANGHAVFSDDLQFATAEGEHWPGGAVRLGWRGERPGDGPLELSADRLDLSALTRIGQRLPLPAAVREALSAHQPQGQLERLQAQWQNAPDGPRYSAKGQWRQARLKPALLAGQWPLPGLQGADVAFDLDQTKGKVQLRMQSGLIEGALGLSEPRLVVDKGQADVEWQLNAGALAIKFKDVQLSNADGVAEASGSWSSAKGEHPWPGVLDLKGKIVRVEARQLHRYLPTAIDANVRDYLRNALLRGQGLQAAVRIKGDLSQFPFRQPQQGEFSIQGQLKDVGFAYVPPPAPTPASSATAARALAGPLEWPALSVTSGELLLDRASLHIKNAKARMPLAANLAWQNIQAQIADMGSAPQVEVSADGRAPLGEWLTLITRSPLGGLTGGVMDSAQGSGQADLRLSLTLPLAALERTRVQGRLVLPGNDLQWSSWTPAMSRLRATVQFTETSLSVTDAQARVWGGDTRLDLRYNTRAAVDESPLSLQVQGAITAEGMRAARDLPGLARLAPFLRGRSNYSFNLGLRQGQPEWQLTSSLQGLEIALPAPLAKSTDATWPLRVEQRVARDGRRDSLQASLGTALNLRYERDTSAATPRVLRGAIALGQGASEALPWPDQGVLIKLNWPQIDLDRWQAVMDSDAVGGLGAAGSSAPGAADGWDAYVPNAAVVQAQKVTWDRRELHQLHLGGTRQGPLWRLNLHAQELEGYLEYRPVQANNPARLYVRLARLDVPPSAVSDLENLLFEQPKSMPAIDMVINELQLRGKKLGRAEVEAVNLPSGPRAIGEWRLNRFNLSVPEAQLSATGSWSAVPGQVRRRTQLKFTLDIADAGEFLARMGTPGAVRAGKGRMEGQVGWQGSPMTIDYPSMSGQFNVNVERGQFLKSDPGAARLLGVLSLQSLPRRLTLDFRDLFSEGFAFDFFRGDVQIEQGVAITNNLQMKGVAAAVLMEGRADIQHETQDIKVVVVPEINAGTASLVYGVINPLAGLTSFLAQLVLRQPLIDVNTRTFRVDGSWADPRVTPISSAEGDAKNPRTGKP